MRAIMAGLIYPGLLTAVGCGLLLRALLPGQADLVGSDWGAALRSREGLAALASMLAAAAGLAAMPWPLHPAGAERAWLWAWGGLELAFLLPLAPALSAGAPRVARAAIRRAQIGSLARALLWAALATALSSRADWRMATLPAHLLALAAALLAFPAAIGWGPWGDEPTISGAGTQAGLAPAARRIDDLARDVAAGSLLAALLVAALPTAVGPAWLGLIMVAAGFVTVGALLRSLEGRLPRLSLPAILRLCWAYVAPLAAAAAVALAIAERVG